jgi:hypothetical protein
MSAAMIGFRDFAPAFGNSFMGVTKGERESLDATLDRVNEWIDTQHIDVINVETLLFPPHIADREEATRSGRELGDPHTSTGLLNFSSGAVQVIRVWYRLPLDESAQLDATADA